ncbi:MAG: N-acetylmuramoyl-L-alanine amidase [Deferribacteraceae bacterium]|jgi:N-acetylmuramoyl-L-alanine amidase|nr:N-acetylmuramoyl-L-alanine amidase [Deferribacteraceae bacterium]
MALVMSGNCFKAILILFFLVSAAYPADNFTALRSEYEALVVSDKYTRTSVITLAERFYRLYASNPKGAGADTALLFAGKAYKISFEKFKNSRDPLTALSYFRTAYTNFSTPAATEAYLEAAEIFIEMKDLASAQFTLNRLINKFPDSTQAVAAAAMLEDINRMADTAEKTQTDNGVKEGDNAGEFTPPNTEDLLRMPPDVFGEIIAANFEDAPKSSGGTAVISDMRYFSADDYTRVVIDLSANSRIEKQWLKADVKAKLPPRLYIDIFNSTVSDKVPKNMKIADGLVKTIRWAYNKPGVTRVVLDSEAIEDFTVFQMENPYRIVIDVTGQRRFAPPPATPPSTAGKPAAGKGNGPTLANAFGLKVRTIVIDPGHGGKDPGCSYSGQKEKEIVLDIAKELKTLLQKDKSLNVYLTRDKDVYIPLEERTAIANKYKADLFISIHINAAPNKTASGIETYVLNVTNDASALEVAAFENKATTKSISDLQGILKDLMLNSKLEESMNLAYAVQKNLSTTLKLSKAQNLGVKQAPFYVLVGAQMPSILIETGFLSNKNDAGKLATAAYRKNIAAAIHKGILEYIAKYNK